MSKKMVWAIAGGLTLFMLVVIGVTAASVLARSQSSVVAPQAQAAPVIPAAGNQAQASAPVAQVALSAQQAAQVAMNLVPGASLTRTPELVNYNGTVAYEVMLNQGTIYVDANSGQVLNAPAQPSNGSGRFGRDGGHEQSEHQSGGEGGGFGGFFGGNDD